MNLVVALVNSAKPTRARTVRILGVDAMNVRDIAFFGGSGANERAEEMADTTP